MFSTLRNRFGIPGVISVIALVFAMVGGAFAANNLGDSGNGATVSAKKKKKSAKGPRGPRGPKGATGPAGPAGPAGAPGAKGDAGANGSNGAPGKDGASGKDGVSVTATEFEGVGGPCSEGGVELESASPEPAYVCGGKPGSPWAVGGTLPSEETETGTWSGVIGAAEFTFVPISFPIPLPGQINAAHFAPDPACPGSIGNPTAEPGTLCIYVQASEGVSLTDDNLIGKPDGGGPGASPSGALVTLEGASGSNAFGTWAITAP